MNLEPINQFQSALYQCLVNDPLLISEIAGAVFDTKPAVETLPPLYVQIGDIAHKSWSYQDHLGREVLFDVAVFGASNMNAKLVPISTHIQAILTSSQFAPPALNTMQFVRMQSYRLAQGSIKRISNRFSAKIDLN